MLRFRPLIVASLVSLLSGAVSADTGVSPLSMPEANPGEWFTTLQGLVLEKGSGLPLSGATVFVSGHDGLTETDDRGWYDLKVSPGTHHLTVSLPGYRSVQLELYVLPGQPPIPPVFLEPREDNSAAMVVQTRRKPRDMSVETLSMAEIERVPGTFGDPIRAVESLPGVARSGLLQGAIVARGAEPANTVVLFDGQPVPFLFHFGFWKSVLNPYFVESIRFYPGNLPSRYGDVLQAVLDVRSREVAHDRVHGAVDVNLVDTSLAVTVPLASGRASVAAAGRFSYLSLLILGGSALIGGNESIFPRYSDYQLRFDAPLLGGRFSALLFGAEDAITLDSDNQAADTPRYAQYGVEANIPYRTRFDHLQLSYRKRLGAKLELSSSTLLGRDFQESQLPFDDLLFHLPSLTLTQKWVGGERAELTWRPTARLNGIGGLDLRFSRASLLDLTNLHASSSTPVPAPELEPASMLALYARAEYEPTPAWLLVAEARASIYAFNENVIPRLEPRAHVRLELSPAVACRAALGMFSQMPEERQYSSQGNPDLKLMRASQGSVGVDVRLPFQIELESTVFGTQMRELALRTTDITYQDTVYGLAYRSKEVFYPGDGWGFGGEVTLRRPLSAEFTGSISYAYIRSLRTSERGLIPGDYDQPHTLTLMGALRLRHRWIMSGRFRVTSGQPYTSLSGAWDSSDDTWFPIPGPRNGMRHKAYHQLDVRLDRTILKNYFRLNFYLDVQNVYLARNPIIEIPDWNFVGAGSYIWVPLIPTLGIKGEF